MVRPPVIAMIYTGKSGIQIECELVCLEPERPDVATITAKVDGQEIGWATTEISRRRNAVGRPDGFSVMDVWVKEGECRKGIARAMYDHAFLSGFGPLYPEIKQSRAGEEFWYSQYRKRFPVGGKQHPVMEWGRIRGLVLSPDLKRLSAQRIDVSLVQEAVERRRADEAQEDAAIGTNSPAIDMAAYALAPETPEASQSVAARHR